jgi:general secretion pathway protein K
VTLRRLSRTRPMRRAPRGTALLLAMIIVVLVVTATAGMVWQQTRAVGIEAAERARAQSAWILSGALDWARLILREDLRGQQGSPHDSLDEPWATPLAEARLSTFLAADQDNNTEGGPEAFISGAISDAQARFNLAGMVDAAGKVVPAQMAAFERLCSVVGTASDTAGRIAEALRAARAPATDDEARGAPLRPSRLSDLVWAGIEAATLGQLEPYVDLLPVPTTINANTAPREVLMAAIDGIDLGTAERLVQRRQGKPFTQLDEIRAELPTGTVLEVARIGVSSSYFEVAGRLRLEDRVLEERSLLVRHDNRVDVLRRERRSFAAALR